MTTAHNRENRPGQARALARERLRAAAAALEAGEPAVADEQQQRKHRCAATTAHSEAVRDQCSSETPASNVRQNHLPPLAPPASVAGAPSGGWQGSVQKASPRTGPASSKPKDRRRIAAILGIAVAVAGGGGWLAVGGGHGPSIGAIVGKDQAHPSAPFGRGAPPLKQSGIGLVSVSPFGYEWSDDGSLTLEMWVYNAERFSAVLDCDVVVSTAERLVAQGAFPSIQGRVPSGMTRPVQLTFGVSDVTDRFADLSNSSIDSRCRWTSR